MGKCAEKNIAKMSEEELEAYFTEKYGGKTLGWGIKGVNGKMREALIAMAEEVFGVIKRLWVLDPGKIEFSMRGDDNVWIEYDRQGICRLKLTKNTCSDEPMALCVIDGVKVTICYAGDCLENVAMAIWEYFGRPDPIPADKKERLTSLYRCLVNQAVDTPEKLEEELKDLLEYWPKMKDDPKVKRLFE